MLDRHAVQALLAAGVRPREAARQVGVSRRTIERIAREAAVVSGDDGVARRARHVGRPRVDDPVHQRLRAWLTAEPDLPPGELWRRLREDGKPLGLSTVYRLLAGVRAKDRNVPAEPVAAAENEAVAPNSTALAAA